MDLGARGLELLKSFEGVRLEAYQDVGKVWTIGYGHTGPDVHAGLIITQAEADQLLEGDVAWAERAVRRLVFIPLTQDQFDALVSFTFNVGEAALMSSHLLLYLNERRYAQAAAEFPRWNIAAGQVLLGLVRRRYAEGQLFIEGTA